MTIPAKTPTPIVAKLNRTVNTVLRMHDLRVAFLKDGLTPDGSTPTATTPMPWSMLPVMRFRSSARSPCGIAAVSSETHATPADLRIFLA